MGEKEVELLGAGVVVLAFTPVIMALLGINPQPFIRAIPTMFIGLCVVIGGLALAEVVASSGR